MARVPRVRQHGGRVAPWFMDAVRDVQQRARDRSMGRMRVDYVAAMLPFSDGRCAVVSGLEADEPVFVLRARDALALGFVAQYAMQATEAGLFDSGRRDALNTQIAEMVEWRHQNGERVRDPD